MYLFFVTGIGELRQETEEGAAVRSRETGLSRFHGAVVRPLYFDNTESLALGADGLIFT